MAKRYLKIASSIFFYLVIFTFTVSLVFWAHNTYKTRTEVRAFQSGIQEDLKYTKEQGNQVAKLEELKRYLLNKDSYGLLGVLGQEKDKRHIGLIAVADARGSLIVRTVSSSGRGVNIFLESSWGRAVAMGSTTASFETSIFNAQEVYLVTSHPIMERETMIGALFASEKIDDTYADNFKKRFLRAGTEIAFYSKQEGIYSSTFQNEEQKNLVRLYFNSHSDWLINTHSGEIVKIANGKYYKVVNVLLPGLEQSNVGALIFIPSYPYFTEINLALLISLLLFTVVKKWLSKLSVQRLPILKHLLYIISSLALITFIILLTLGIWFKKISTVQKPTFTIYNSTLSLQPDSGIIDESVPQTVNILVNKGEEAVNAVDITLTYDPTHAQIKEIDTKDSFCSYFVEKEIDPVKGLVHVVCGAPSPGLVTQSGIVASLVVIAKESFTLHFSPESQVLANDGLGTNVLRKANDASFILEPAGHATYDQFHVHVYSSSHPNSERWYRSRTAYFNWQPFKDRKYVYSFDTSSTTVLSLARDTVTDINNVKIPLSSDGIYYFHIAMTDGKTIGPVSSQKIRIDMTPPSEVTIKTSDTEIHLGETVRLEFSGVDTTSGIQPNYYVRINEGSFLLPVKKELYVPFTKVGLNTLTLRIFDNAENYSEALATILVK